jgi:hypothetical protein
MPEPSALRQSLEALRHQLNGLAGLDAAGIEALEVRLLGRKQALTELLRQLPLPEEKRIGAEANRPKLN